MNPIHYFKLCLNHRHPLVWLAAALALWASSPEKTPLPVKDAVLKQLKEKP